MTAAGRAIPEGTRLVHIGPHKTGSTAIQVALYSARERLAERGVAYVTTGGYRPRRAGWSLGVTGRPSGTAQPPLEYWRRFVEAVESADAPRVCVSNEDFGRAKRALVARLVEDLGGDRVRVVSVVRRLDRYLASQWQERVKAGEYRTYEAWLRVVLDRESRHFEWERRNVWHSHDVRRLVERWVNVVPPEHFTAVVSDEADHSVLPRTFESMLGLPQGFLVLDPSRSNRGLNWPETELIRSVNQLLAERGLVRAQRRGLLAAGVHQDMQGRPPAPGPKSPPLPDWAAGRLRDLSDQRVHDLEALGERGVNIVGDPELMRIPAEVEPVPPPVTTPSIDLDTAAGALASALAAMSLDAIAEEDNETADDPGPG